MSYTEQVRDKHNEYLADTPICDLPEDVRDYVSSMLYDAAKAYMDAGYSGSWNDGGASNKVQQVKFFVKGFRLGRAAVRPQDSKHW